MDKLPECRHCAAPMEEGFILDQAHGVLHVPTWIKGKPERSFWSGLKTDRDQYKVQTFRCPKCGYLESYALS